MFTKVEIDAKIHILLDEVGGLQKHFSNSFLNKLVIIPEMAPQTLLKQHLLLNHQSNGALSPTRWCYQSEV